jgi:hypothetical protein
MMDMDAMNQIQFEFGERKNRNAEIKIDTPSARAGGKLSQWQASATVKPDIFSLRLLLNMLIRHSFFMSVSI